MGDIIRLPHSYGGEASESAVRATLSRMRIDRLRAFEQMCQLKAELSEAVGGQLTAFYRAWRRAWRWRGISTVMASLTWAVFARW
jgi:hypothetical protein